MYAEKSGDGQGVIYIYIYILKMSLYCSSSYNGRQGGAVKLMISAPL